MCETLEEVSEYIKELEERAMLINANHGKAHAQMYMAGEQAKSATMEMKHDFDNCVLELQSEIKCESIKEIVAFFESLDEEFLKKEPLNTKTDIMEENVADIAEVLSEPEIMESTKFDDGQSDPLASSEVEDDTDEDNCTQKPFVVVSVLKYPVACAKGSPSQYLLYDGLVANIFDYDENNIPWVRLELSKSPDSNLPVECGICPAVMLRYHLPAHLKTHWVPDAEGFACIYCDKFYKQRHLLAAHARRHLAFRPYNCGFCELYFSTKQDMLVHHQRRHKSKQYKCEECGRMFAQNTRLKRHIEATHEKMLRFQCDQCPKAFYWNFNLKEHIRKIHLGDRRLLKCPFCSLTCYSSHQMATHRKKQHSNQKCYTCFICEEVFTDITFFTAHKRSLQCRANTIKTMEETEMRTELNLE